MSKRLSDARQSTIRITNSPSISLTKTSSRTGSTLGYRSSCSLHRFCSFKPGGESNSPVAGGVPTPNIDKLFPRKLELCRTSTAPKSTRNEPRMNRTLPAICAFCIFVFCAAAAEGADSRDTRPNIVFILIDDMFWYGTSIRMDAENPGSAMAYIKMPNVEKLATQGMTFRNARAAAGMCAPWRRDTQFGLICRLAYYLPHPIQSRRSP